MRKRHAQGYSCDCVQVALGPGPDYLDAARGPDFFARLGDLEILGFCHKKKTQIGNYREGLSPVAAHNVDKGGTRIVGAAGERDAAALHAGRAAVEVLVFRPVHVALGAEPAALKLHKKFV